MKTQPQIRVGLITDGDPRIINLPGRSRVFNLLIGDGFHWEQKISRDFEGIIKMLDRRERNVSAVNIIPLESYIKSVISSEMNPGAPLEFLKAHAVISRGWALRKIYDAQNQKSEDFRFNNPQEIYTWEEFDSHSGFDVCSDDHCQRYQGIPRERYISAIKAARDTCGEVLLDKNGNVADTRFSKCCGGKTELFSTCWADEDFDYLISKKDPWCDLSGMSDQEREKFLDSVLKNYDRETHNFSDWTLRINKNSVSRIIREKHGIDIGSLQSIRIIDRGHSGRIKRMEFIGNSGSIIIGKELAIRKLLDKDCLYSSWFEINDSGEWLILTGHGWGHGVGLCQIGAARMAYEGINYREILKFYYPNCELRKVYE